MLATSQRRPRGFSLVEITIALGVAGFCLLAILGLLHTGLTSEQTTVGKTAAWGILSTVFSDLNSVPSGATESSAYGISLSSPSPLPQTIYFTKTGKPTGRIGSTPTPESYYRVSIGFQSPAPSFPTPPLVRLVASWPANADPAPEKWPEKASGTVEVVTALRRD